ncbi:nose resistant to fluoxetine protein 6-like [Diadema antillarum]|uniref:nose resistant to fluoxetine protein 6-like n=1 Tax=Diadema antillarum TaxID=105358 RepID=UPI003A83B0E5
MASKVQTRLTSGKVVAALKQILQVSMIASLYVPSASGFMTPTMVGNMLSAGRPLLQPHNPSKISEQCDAELVELFVDGGEKLVKVLDATGKPQAGILVGNWAWLGHFDECMGISGFKYCAAYFQVTLPNITIIGEPPLVWGLCVPESCSNSDVLSSLNYFVEQVEAPFSLSAVNGSAALCATDPPAAYNTGFIITVCLIAVLSILVIMGALVDKTLRSINYKAPPTTQKLIINRNAATASTHPYQRVVDPTPEGGRSERGDQPIVSEPWVPQEIPTACTQAWHQFFLSFAVNRNLSKLMKAATSEGSISCLNGIRVISMSWVILGHLVTFVLQTGTVGNVMYGYNQVGRFGFQAINNAFFSVDSFFFLSGLLVAYMTLGRMAKSGGSVPWLWFYFHRYWRLTPALGVTMLVHLYLKPHLGTGPAWQTQVSDPGCERYWWTNILYINNFYDNKCIDWVWYLANDTQFFIISPFILILLYRKPVCGFLSLAVLTIISIVVTAYLMVKYKFRIDVVFFADPTSNPLHSFENEIYVKPYCRIAPYLVGMAMGYLLHNYKDKTVKIHPILAATGWAVATAVAMALVYGLYGDYHGHPIPVVGRAAYMSLSKFAWGVCLSWVVFACRFGYAGWVNDFLSWELWIPMSRLTYSAYLLHPIILNIYSFNMINPYYFSYFTVPFEFAGVFVLAYSAAVLMALLVEFPLGNLEKMVMPSSKTKAS